MRTQALIVALIGLLSCALASCGGAKGGSDRVTVLQASPNAPVFVVLSPPTTYTLANDLTIRIPQFINFTGNSVTGQQGYLNVAGTLCTYAVAANGQQPQQTGCPVFIRLKAGDNVDFTVGGPAAAQLSAEVALFKE